MILFLRTNGKQSGKGHGQKAQQYFLMLCGSQRLDVVPSATITFVNNNAKVKISISLLCVAHKMIFLLRRERFEIHGVLVG